MGLGTNKLSVEVLKEGAFGGTYSGNIYPKINKK